MRTAIITASGLLALFTAGSATAQEAANPTVEKLSFKACGQKYQAAKADGSLAGQKWLDYRRIHCGIGPNEGRRTLPKPAIRSEAVAAEALSRISFPAGLASEFQNETPAKARMRTCLQGYHANKQAGTLYGMRWVQTGGGYYSVCNSRLKKQLS